MKTCPDCKGAKELHGYACPGFRPITIPCSLCMGNGEVPESVIEAVENGKAMRADRLARGLSQREESARLHISPVELSHLEGGRPA